MVIKDSKLRDKLWKVCAGRCTLGRLWCAGRCTLGRLFGLAGAYLFIGQGSSPRAFNVAVQTDCQSHSALVAHPDGLGALFRVRVEREVFPSNEIKTELDSLDPTRSKQNSILSSPPLVPAKTPVRSRKATRGISARPSQPSQTVDCSG